MNQMRKISKAVTSFAACEKGTTPIEYGMIAVLVSTSVIVGAGAIGSSSAVTLDAVTQVWPQG